MKILYKTMGLGLLPACLFLLCTAPAAAKVCFVGEENCTGGGSFEDYKDPGEDGKLCEAEGYMLKDNCTADQAKYVAGYCPYNNAYVRCCGKEYAYDLCSYPLVSDGKCGSKHKCVCDAKFPFNDKYEETSCKIKYPGAVADGGSCVQTGYDAQSGGSITDIYFSECVCNPAIYCYVKEDCVNGTEPSDDGCTGTDGITRYGACICDREKYEFAAGDCEFGGNIDKKEYYCIQGGAYYFDRCYECDAYPATTLDHVLGGEGVGYEKCTYGKRYKILQCEAGYRPGKDGGNCRELTCEEAVDEWLTTYPEQKERYTLLASPGNIQDSKLVNATSNAANIKTKNVILGDDQTLTHIYAGINYYGASAFGKMKGGYMKERCKTRPNIVYNSSENGFWIPKHSPFGWSQSTKGSVKLYGLKLDMTKLKGTFSTTYGIEARNVDITAGNWTIPTSVDYAPKFMYDAYYDNEGYEAMPAINITGTLTIQSPVTFDGMSFNKEDAYAGRGSVRIEVPSSYKGQTIATFKFKEDQEFHAGSIYMYPNDDSDCGNDKINNCYTDYNTTVQFQGPSGENPANVYTYIYLGYGYKDKYKGSHNMFAQISGHLIWNLYKGSSNYRIYLSPGSKIYSTDYGAGEYARIKRGSDSKLGWCKMDESQLYADRKKDAWLCTDSCTNRQKWNADYYMVCGIDKSLSANQQFSGWYTVKGATRCGCSQQTTTISGCSYSAGGWTQVPISCGDSKL